MKKSDVSYISSVGLEKNELCKLNTKKYFSRAIMAGMFLVIGIVVSYVTGGIIYEQSPTLAKIALAATFSFALILITFIGGELFTGSNFILGISLYEKRCSFNEVIKVWMICLLGNAIGIIFLMVLFYLSGASIGVLENYLKELIPAKLELSVIELFLRGVFCNFMVCVAFLAGLKMHSETGKIIVMFFAIFGFVIVGFEHSVANIGIFSLSAMVLKDVSIILVMKNLLFVTLGNMVGGAILLAGPIWYMAID